MIFKSSYPDAVISEVPVGTRFLEKLGTYGDLTALIDGDTGNEITFAQLQSDVIEYAATLQSLGVRKGHVIILVVSLKPEYVALLIAISLCGAVFNFSYSNKEAAEHAQMFNPYLMIVEDICPVGSNVLCRVLTLTDLRGFNLTLDPTTRVFPIGECVDVHEDPIAIFNSSGTTGKSKGIVHIHYSINAMIDQYDGFNIDQTDCALLNLPRFHYGAIFMLFKRLFSGVKLVVEQHLTVPKIYTLVPKYNVNVLLSTNTPVIIDLINNGKVPELDSLKLLAFGGMPFPTHMKEKLEKEIGILMFSLYGASENGMISLDSSKKCPKASCGKLISNTKVRIVDIDEGSDLGFNKVGEIVTKSPLVMKEYYKPSDEDKLVKDSSGWFHTGDVGYISDGGYLYITDRIKNIIKGLGGITMYPSEIESILLKHPHVKDAAVIGVHHPQYSEVVKAFVVSGHESADSNEILAFYNDQVLDARKIRGGIQFIDIVPRVGIGKIDRQQLLKLHNETV